MEFLVKDNNAEIKKQIKQKIFFFAKLSKSLQFTMNTSIASAKIKINFPFV